MAAPPLNPEILEFMADHVRSVEQLEILCWLKEQGSRTVTAQEVFRVIQSSPESIARCLEQFRAGGLVVLETPGTYHFNTDNPQLVRKANALVTAYRERRVTVIESIYRKSAIQNFADAFKMRKGTKNG